MGDSFSFLTDNDQPSGANGFPFAYTFSAHDGLHPVSVDFVKLHKWWWKVKNWSLATDAAIVDTDMNPWSMANGALAPSASNAAQELDLIQPLRVHEFIDTGSEPNSEVQFSIFRSGVISDSGVLYPGFEGNPAVGINNPAKGLLTLYFTNPGGGLPSISGSIDGVSLPIYYDAVAFPPHSFTFSQFDLTIEDTWSY